MADWQEGQYNVADHLGLHSLPALWNRLERYIASKHPIGWVAGFFDQSLTASLAAQRGMAPALYIDVDCDLYSSTVTVLEWLFESRLLLHGTVIAYDDIAVAGGYKAGEGLAHLEVMRKYNVTTRELDRQCCYEIVSYNGMPTNVSVRELPAKDAKGAHG